MVLSPGYSGPPINLGSCAGSKLSIRPSSNANGTSAIALDELVWIAVGQKSLTSRQRNFVLNLVGAPHDKLRPTNLPTVGIVQPPPELWLRREAPG